MLCTTSTAVLPHPRTPHITLSTVPGSVHTTRIAIPLVLFSNIQTFKHSNATTQPPGTFMTGTACNASVPIGDQTLLVGRLMCIVHVAWNFTTHLMPTPRFTWKNLFQCSTIVQKFKSFLRTLLIPMFSTGKITTFTVACTNDLNVWRHFQLNLCRHVRGRSSVDQIQQTRAARYSCLQDTVVKPSWLSFWQTNQRGDFVKVFSFVVVDVGTRRWSCAGLQRVQ